MQPVPRARNRHVLEGDGARTIDGARRFERQSAPENEVEGYWAHEKMM